MGLGYDLIWAMGKIGPEGLSSPDARSSRRRLYPIGRDTISAALPILQNSDRRAQFTREENAAMEAENYGLARYVKRAYTVYQTGEKGVGGDAFYGFYDGVLVTHGLLRLQAPDQIPVFLKRQKQDDVEDAIQDEKKRRCSYAESYRVSETAFELLAYRRILDLSTQGTPDEAHLANLLLAQAENHPVDGEAFLAGAAAFLFPVIDLWQKREKQREKIEENERTRRKFRFWASRQGEDPDSVVNAYVDWTQEATEELAHALPVWIH